MSTNDDEIGRLADGWIQYWYATDGSDARGKLSWVSEKEIDLLFEDSEGYWRFILAAYRKDDSPLIRGMLSAGPLEDLLKEYGPAFIDRIEHESERDSSFARLLCGVWLDPTYPVWDRVEALQNLSRDLS